MSKNSFCLSLALAIIFLTTVTVFSEPRFALRTGSRCDVCHVNPTGGGMRNDYGALYYAMEELPMPGLQQKAGSTTIDRNLSKNVQFGSDMRLLYYSNTEWPYTNTFFNMQGDIYLNLALNDYLSAYLRKGIYTDYEAYGMFKLSKINSYLKFGYISPPYGLKFAEHSSFVRSDLTLDPHFNDAGVEIGYEPKPFSFAFAILNGAPSALTDYNENKAVYFRSLFVRNLGQNSDILLGASIRNMDLGFLSRMNYSSWGVDAGLRYSWFSLLGESDWIYSTTHGVAALAEASFLVEKGIDFRTSYEYFNPDISTTYRRLQRLNFAIALFPMPYSEFQAKYRFHLGDSPEIDRLFLTLHLFM